MVCHKYNDFNYVHGCVWTANVSCASGAGCIPFEGHAMVAYHEHNSSTYGNYIWIVPIAHMIILTRLVTTFFELFNKDLEKEIKKNKNRIPDSFSKLCILHQDISKLLTELDAEMRWFFAVSFSFFIFLLIFVLYWIIKTSKPLNTIYIHNHSHVLFNISKM